MKNIRKNGAYFLSRLKKIKSDKIIEARGTGLMLAIELTENATWLLKALQGKNIIVIPAGSNVVRFLPPFIITKKEIDILIRTLKKIFN